MGDNDPFMRNQNAAVQGRAKAQNRANVLQLKMIGQNHPTGLTSNLLKLFEPRPPLEYRPPPEKRKCPPYTGMAHLVSHFAEPNDPEYAPPVPTAETPAEKRARIHQSRLQKGAEKVAEELQKYDPNSDPNIAGDPYKTLFVAKLSYETTESRLKREFESYGPIKRVGTHKKPRNGFDSQKPRGYAFIEYMHTRDMKAAYKQGDGKKIDGRRVLVDVERGRTVPNWRPRRLGGGLGTSRMSIIGDDGSQRNSVREQQQPGGSSRSEEPRAREDRPDREKSRERARDKDVEREKSRERSHDRPRDRDREDRHRDRDRRDRDRGSRGHDRDRTRDRDRDHRRERTRDRDRDYEVVDRDRDRDVDYDRVDSKHERHSKRDHKSYDQPEAEDEGEWHRSDYDNQYEHHRERGSSRYDDANDGDRYDHYPNEAHHDYHYGRASSRDNMDQE